MTTTEQYIDAIIQRELKARMDLLEQTLIANGCEVTAENEHLNIKHPNGSETTAYFSKTKMRNTLLEGIGKTLDTLDEEVRVDCLKCGSDALAEKRPEYIKKYSQSLEQNTQKAKKKKPSKKQELEAMVKAMPEKEDPTLNM